MKKILITGSAGFIGFHLVNKLSGKGFEITGIDNLNSYYDKNLKYRRLEKSGIDKDEIKEGSEVKSSTLKNYKFIKLDIKYKNKLLKLFEKEKYSYVIHLAAQAGIRYSLVNPDVYVQSNILGFYNLLEACKEYRPEHLIFASSSSVYGNNKKIPFTTKDNTDKPVSHYAATKKSNEVMAYAYSSLYGIKTTGLRFFSVYGPWGRPDMAYFSFAKNIVEGKPIKVFAGGKLKRDFTYIDDIVENIKRIIRKYPDSDEYGVRFKLYNIGNNKPVEVKKIVSQLEKYLNKKALVEFHSMQKGDVIRTHAELNDLYKLTGYKPVMEIENGLKKFCDWFLEYNNN